MLRRGKQYELANRRVIYVNHKLDNRYGSSKIISHDRRECPSFSVEKLADIWTSALENDVVCVDEGQFVGVEQERK